MLQLCFVASNNTETGFIELISNEQDRVGTAQNGRKQYIQAGNRAENKTFTLGTERSISEETHRSADILLYAIMPIWERFYNLKSIELVDINSKRNRTVRSQKSAERRKSQKAQKSRRKAQKENHVALIRSNPL